jgi:hypothetical protein
MERRIKLCLDLNCDTVTHGSREDLNRFMEQFAWI